MKELTIEEKAKAYDEVKRLIESIYQDLSHDKQMEAEALFPEIAESDDKKVIKGIESIIKHYRDKGEIVCPYPFVTIEETLAWLEKQGQKPTEWHREDEQNLNACLGYIPDEFLRRWLTDIIYAKHDQSAWSEEDYDRISSIKYLLHELDNHNFDNWFDSLKHKHQYNKPSWSEEDEKILNGLISSLARIGASTRTDTTSINYTFSKEIDWLKSLRSQPKQEWSEKDESHYQMLQNIICDSGASAYLANKLSDWLTSLKLRKSWKPTEEQMNALDSTLQYSKVSRNSYDSLNSLYNDLKKLTE